MPTDPTFNDTDGVPEEPLDEAGALHTPNPPRPPRPGKRSRGSGRIPMPLPPSLPGDELGESLADAAPRVSIDDERDEPAIPLMPARAKLPSARPEESFADLNGDPSDRAPAAPVTPWRSVPAFQAEPVEATPPRASPVAFSRDFDREDEHEATMVGKVPINLLELSSSGDENTRAFTAPRELIELAKRKREESRASKAPVEAHIRETERPPAAAAPPVPLEEKEEVVEARAAPAVPAQSGPPPRLEEDAAPPVARSISGEMEAVALPSRRARESEAPEPSGPDIEIGPGSEVSDPRVVPSGAPPGSVSIPISEPQPSAAKSSPRRWLLMTALFMLVGIVIARWRDIAALLR